MSIDATRLLVLGAVRQEQPASGYAIMRELIGWGVREWASVNPGTIYGALNALEKEGLVLVSTDEAAASGRSHKNSAKFRITTAGGEELADLLTGALSAVEVYRPAGFMAALCFLVDLPRSSILAALRLRITNLQEALTALDEAESAKVDDVGKPLHSVEFVRISRSRLAGEAAFVEDLVARIDAGEYRFDDDL